MDITSRAGGHTEVATPLDDTTVPWETSARILDRIVIALSGSAAERVILGEHTTGGETDNDRAVMLAMRWVKAGFAGPGVFLGEDGLGFSYLTDEVKTDDPSDPGGRGRVPDPRRRAHGRAQGRRPRRRDCSL